MTKIIQHNNKYKNIENISEISIENFKNKLFLKKQDKLDDIMDSFHYKNFCSESKSKKSKFYKKSHSKFNSPKIFLKNDLEDKFSPKKKSAPEIEFKLDSKNKSLSPIKTRDLTQNNEVSFKLNKLSKFSLCSELEIKEKNSIKEKKINWKIGEKLAEGLTSTIFKALNTNDGSTLVIKKFNSNTNEKIINNYKVSKFKIE